MSGRWRRRVGISAGVAVLLVAILATMAAFHRSPYAFLDHYRPRRVPIDLTKIATALPARMPKMTMLVFRYADAPAILAEMRTRLSKENGFDSRESFAGDAQWEFYRGVLPPVGSTVVPDGLALYSAGQSTAYEKGFLESGGSMRVFPGQPPPKACIVLITSEDTWFERTMDAVRGFLHL